MRHFIDDPSGWRLNTSGDLLLLLHVVVDIMVRFCGPALLLFMIFGIAGSVIQNRPRIVWQRVTPDLSRVSPIAGFFRLFSLRTLTEFAKSIFKIAVVAGVVVFTLTYQKLTIINSIFTDVSALPKRLLSLCTTATATVTIAMGFLAAADYSLTLLHWRRDQRMSKYEVKEEMKQAEGDRMLKARMRSLRMSRARQNMLKNVPKATMVVVNPTHYAVAMRYVRSEGGAPVVLAKGLDLIALKIREIAFENDIPVIEDKPLARSLYDVVTVDATIPPEFYKAVAEIVHLIQSKRNDWSKGRRRLN